MILLFYHDSNTSEELYPDIKDLFGKEAVESNRKGRGRRRSNKLEQNRSEPAPSILPIAAIQTMKSKARMRNQRKR